MNYKPFLPNTVSVSTLGFGGFPLGNISQGHIMSESEGVHLVKAAFAAGITLFDTAPNYALGQSETIIGKALNEVRDRVVIVSKFGHHDDDRLDFRSSLMEPSINRSLKRLQTSYLDTLLLHNPPLDILQGKTDHFHILEHLKARGVIRSFGVSLDTRDELLTLLNHVKVDVVELLFNVFAQSTRDLFSILHQRNIRLIIKVPLDSGWLTGGYQSIHLFSDIRSRWTEDVKIRRHTLVSQLIEMTHDPALAKYALGFIWSYPEVTTIIPGIRTMEQLNDHLSSWKYPFPVSFKESFEAFYDAHIKGCELPW